MRPRAFTAAVAGSALLFILLGPAAQAQDAAPDDVGSMDSILTALYDVISGPAGEERDWNRFRSLFYDDARLTPTRPSPAGGDEARVMTPEDYVQQVGPWLVASGFREHEIGRRVEQYGPVAHAFSAYEGEFTGPEGEQSLRGINSIQLFFDGDRWWVMSVLWAAETEERPLPEALLQ